MSSTAHAPDVLIHLPSGVDCSPVQVGSRLRRAFSLSTDAAVDTWEEATGHRAPLAWVQWQVRAVLYGHGVVGAAGKHCAMTVAGFVVREATAAVEAGRDPRRAVLTRIPWESFKASRLWPGLHPMVVQARSWEQFSDAAATFYAQANADAATAVAASDTATTFGPMAPDELEAETARIARWLWETWRGPSRPR